MKLINAIQLLAPYHNALVTCIVRKDNGKFDAQLSTGLDSIPFVAVNDSEVCVSDILEVLDCYDNVNNQPQLLIDSSTYQEPITFFDQGTVSELEIWGCT